VKRLLVTLALIGAALQGANQAWPQTPARDAGYLYLSPVPDAPYVSPQTRYVLLRFKSVLPSQVTNLLTTFISVTGYLSGSHPGKTHLASDGKTLIFEMGTDFATNELVAVTLTPFVAPGTSGSVQGYEYYFMVSAPMPGTPAATPHFVPGPAATTSVTAQAVGPPEKPVGAPSSSGAQALATPVVLSNGVSVPSDFPKVTITANSNPSPGYLFLENALNGVPPYTMMLDNQGLPVWYQRGRMYDFKIQKNGMITWALSDDTGLPAFDQNFNYLKTYLTTNGYSTDSHDLRILPDGSYYMIGYRLNPVNLSLYYSTAGTDVDVRETVVQGFTAAGELIFQWRAWDNYNIADLNGNGDFPHMNGLDIDEDGNILVSARHLSEVTKIDRNSGDVIWRLSGPHSTFRFVGDPFNGTSFQHSISALGNGHYMVFDNGDTRTPMVSRAAEYQLDLTNLTATLTWQFRDQPDKYTYYLGSAQRLPTGNTLINFVLAQYPKAIEVDSNGLKHFELSLTPGSDAYRAFRFPWNGAVAAPYLVVEPRPDNVTMIFNKFGDTNVAYYRIYGGTSTNPATLLATSTTTLKQISDLPNAFYYFRVTAVSRAGVESPFSNQESLNVNITEPGGNMVQNGDFSQGYSAWAFSVNTGAGADWTTDNGIAHFYITNGGTMQSSIQLRQSGQAIILGSKYVLEFDAWSSQPRYIDAHVAQLVSPFSNYSQPTATYLTPTRAHFRYPFTMRLSSDSNASLVFNLGASVGDVYIDNVSLFSLAAGDLNQDGSVDYSDLSIFVGGWLKQQSGLPADIDGNGKVDFNDFNLLGGTWATGSR
jgi:hypothetical protein